MFAPASSGEIGCLNRTPESISPRVIVKIHHGTLALLYKADVPLHFRTSAARDDFVGQAILPAAAFQAALARHVRVSAPRGRRLKAGGSQDWLPHNAAETVAGRRVLRVL